MTLRSIALCDVNNFYVSCQVNFSPKLRGKPVVVLSNNDGNVISRSAEAKAIGIKMGDPWFQVRERAERDGIIAFSSNFELYADMSDRVMKTLSRFSPNYEVYSIDEAFLDLTGMPGDHGKLASRIRSTVLQHTGLAACVGVGTTKTLAKIANHAAKKGLSPHGVCNLNAYSPEALSSLLSRIEIEDVWGVGRRLAPRLMSLGIHTALDLQKSNPEYIRQQFSVVLEKTVRELNGVVCLDLEEVTPPRKQIVVSRAFGERLTRKEDVRAALSAHIARAAEKLRKQGGFASILSIHIATSPFGQDPQYAKPMSIPLPSPTDDTLQLLRSGLWMLDRIWKNGYRYYRAGAMLSEIVPAGGQQVDLFGYRTQDDKSAKLMHAMDAINQRWGRKTIRPASHVKGTWEMKRLNLSPCYTTRLEDLLVVS